MRRRRDQQKRDQAFEALVRKFSRIQYLVEQRAFAEIIEKAPVGICITNKEHIYEYVNDAYCRIYGYTPEELIGNSFTMVVPEQFQEQMISLHDQFMDREYELEGEWQVKAKDGQVLTILANAAYVVDEKRRPKKITFVLDISQRTRALADLEKAHEQLDAETAELDNARTTMLSAAEELQSVVASLQRAGTTGSPDTAGPAEDEAVVDRKTERPAIGRLEQIIARLRDAAAE